MLQNSEPSLCFLGAGKVGSVLAYHFLKSKIKISGIIERDETKHSHLTNFFPEALLDTSPSQEIISQSSLIFISVQDDHLSKAVEQLCDMSTDFLKKIIVHTSGAHSSKILSPLKKQSAQIASAHPIYAFSGNDPDKISLKGVYFDLEGDTEAVRKLTSLFQKVQIKVIKISTEQKLAIHIASVFYSNYFVGLAQNAQKVLHDSQISSENYWQPFLPLIQSTINNLSSNTPDEALTGPIKRGDITTIEKHLKFLETNLPEVKKNYIRMAQLILNSISLPTDVENKLTTVLKKFNPSK